MGTSPDRSLRYEVVDVFTDRPRARVRRLLGPSERTAHARVFVGGHGVAEDPATGSAALGLGVWLVASGAVDADGPSAYSVRQGAEVHRPSLLECTVVARGGRAVSATVTGAVVPGARGEIAAPPRG